MAHFAALKRYGQPYSEAEDAYLRANLDLPTAELARALDRAPTSVRKHVAILLRDDGARRIGWTEEKDARLRELAATGLSDAGISRALGCSEEAARRRRNALGIERPSTADLWPAARDDDLRRRVLARQADREIAEAMGASLRQIKRRRALLDLPTLARPAPRARAPDHRAETAEPADDEAFVDRLCRLGGMPRAVIVGGRTVWLGPDNRPWIDPDRRRAA